MPSKENPDEAYTLNLDTLQGTFIFQSIIDTFIYVYLFKLTNCLLSRCILLPINSLLIEIE